MWDPLYFKNRRFQFETVVYGPNHLTQVSKHRSQIKPIPVMSLDHLCPRGSPRCDWLSHLLPRAAVAADSKTESHSLMSRADIFNFTKYKKTIILFNPYWQILENWSRFFPKFQFSEALKRPISGKHIQFFLQIIISGGWVRPIFSRVPTQFF